MKNSFISRWSVQVYGANQGDKVFGVTSFVTGAVYLLFAVLILLPPGPHRSYFFNALSSLRIFANTAFVLLFLAGVFSLLTGYLSFFKGLGVLTAFLPFLFMQTFLLWYILQFQALNILDSYGGSTFLKVYLFILGFYIAASYIVTIPTLILMYKFYKADKPNRRMAKMPPPQYFGIYQPNGSVQAGQPSPYAAPEDCPHS